jgi:hypothetical protein
MGQYLSDEATLEISFPIHYDTLVTRTGKICSLSECIGGRAGEGIGDDDILCIAIAAASKPALLQNIQAIIKK